MNSKIRLLSSELRKLASTLVVNGTDLYEAGQISLRNTGTLFQAADEIDRLRKTLELYANEESWKPSNEHSRMLFEHWGATGGWEPAVHGLDGSPPKEA